jgi:sulfide:quinone oxidoreductase
VAHRIVILGGGTGGTAAANRLRRRLGDDASIVVVDRDDRHVYQPGLLFVPFNLADPRDLVRPRGAQLKPGIGFRTGEVERVDLERQAVELTDGAVLPYDVLVVATGADLQPGETEGLAGDGPGGYADGVFTFYELASATALREALRRFDGGRLLVDVVDVPIKCPVAPLEFCFLADWFLQERGVRDRTEIVLATPLDAAFTRPVAAEHLAGTLDAKDVRLELEFATGEVDAAGRRVVSWDDRELAYDLLAVVPAHGGPAFVGRSDDLGDDLGFVRTDPHTLQAAAAPTVFAIGDATNLPTSKAGSVAHFEGETLVANVCHVLAHEPLEASFDGHANCFIETGFERALLIDFNYDVEPLPGRFPDPRLGPLPLLRDARRNHLAKLATRWAYWNVLLAGHDLPGVHAQLRSPPVQGGRP